MTHSGRLSRTSAPLSRRRCPWDWVFHHEIRFWKRYSNGNIEMIWCETIDGEARNMIKSDEHRFATSSAGCHAAFALKGKDFS